MNPAEKEGLEQKVKPSSKKKNPWAKASWTPAQFRAYYQKNFAGRSRAEVQQDTKHGGQAFYAAVSSRQLQDKVFPQRRRVNYDSWEIQDFRDHYQENFSGLSRGQVAEDQTVGGRNFYMAVSRRGFVDEVFPDKVNNDYGKTVDDFKKYYHQHFKGRSRKEVRDDTRQRGFSFYVRVARKGWLNEVFPPCNKKPPGYYQNLENIRRELEEIIEDFGKLPTAREIQRTNNSLLQAIYHNQGGYEAVKIKLGYAVEELEVIRQIISQGV